MTRLDFLLSDTDTATRSICRFSSSMPRAVVVETTVHVMQIWKLSQRWKVERSKMRIWAWISDFFCCSNLKFWPISIRVSDRAIPKNINFYNQYLFVFCLSICQSRFSAHCMLIFVYFSLFVGNAHLFKPNIFQLNHIFFSPSLNGFVDFILAQSGFTPRHWLVITIWIYFLIKGYF